MKVMEFFSLTCTHCAAFHKEIFPRVKRELVETGPIRMVWRDFPLDQLALAAAAVARSLPAERYEGFIGALLSSQDRWAFTRGDPTEELAKMAALAGMRSRASTRSSPMPACSAPSWSSAWQAERSSTSPPPRASPSRARRAARNQSGNMPFDRFQQLVEEARRG